MNLYRILTPTFLVWAFCAAVLPPAAHAQNLHLAPPPFGPDQSYVPIDIDSIAIDYTFDIDERRVWAKATMTFKQERKGKPFFDIVPEPSALTLDGKTLEPKVLKEVKTPGDETTLRVLDVELEPSETRTVTMAYNLHRIPKFRGGTVSAGFFVSDLDDRWFFERFGPTNLQFDQIRYTFNVTVKGATEPHRIFANGTVEDKGEGKWQVRYPDYFNTSTLYFHLVPESSVKVMEGVFKGKERDIPVTVYNRTGDRLQKYFDVTMEHLGKLEQRFGATIHPAFTVYVTGGGGMEYSGATITGHNAIAHELTHSWYARGVFPSDGNSSWVDEAVASWQDCKYVTAKTGPSGPPVNLSAHSVYVRDTDVKAYKEGLILVAQLDNLFKDQGGISPILASFYQRMAKKLLTTESFKAHIQKESGVDMEPIFDRFVYGKGSFADGALQLSASESASYPTTATNPAGWQSIAAYCPKPAQQSLHPRRLTRQELYDLQ